MITRDRMIARWPGKNLQRQPSQALSTHSNPEYIVLRRHLLPHGSVTMESKVKVAGHPIHPMLIVFPLGLLATAVIFDIISLSTSDSKWHSMAWYMIGAGVIG